MTILTEETNNRHIVVPEWYDDLLNVLKLRESGLPKGEIVIKLTISRIADSDLTLDELRLLLNEKSFKMLREKYLSYKTLREYKKVSKIK